MKPPQKWKLSKMETLKNGNSEGMKNLICYNAPMREVFTFDASHLNDLTKNLTGFVKNSDSIMNGAINASMSKSRTASIRQATSIWSGMGTRTFKVHTTLQKSNPRNGNTALFTIKSSPISLSDFKARQLPPRTRRRGRKKDGLSQRAGVSYKLKGRQRTMPSAWMAKSKFSNSLEVFVEDKNDPRKRVRRASITPTSMFLGAKADFAFLFTFREAFYPAYTNQLNRFKLI